MLLYGTLNPSHTHRQHTTHTSNINYQPPSLLLISATAGCIILSHPVLALFPVVLWQWQKNKQLSVSFWANVITNCGRDMRRPGHTSSRCLECGSSALTSCPAAQAARSCWAKCWCSVQSQWGPSCGSAGASCGWSPQGPLVRCGTTSCCAAGTQVGQRHWGRYEVSAWYDPHLDPSVSPPLSSSPECRQARGDSNCTPVGWIRYCQNQTHRSLPDRTQICCTHKCCTHKGHKFPNLCSPLQVWNYHFCGTQRGWSLVGQSRTCRSLIDHIPVGQNRQCCTCRDNSQTYHILLGHSQNGCSPPGQIQMSCRLLYHLDCPVCLSRLLNSHPCLSHFCCSHGDQSPACRNQSFSPRTCCMELHPEGEGTLRKAES